MNLFCKDARLKVEYQGLFIIEAVVNYFFIGVFIVTSIETSFADSLVTLYHENKKLLQSTPNHPIFTPAGYKLARDFLEGDSILSIEGNYIVVTSLKQEYAPQQVYNFEVGELHTYFAEGILVHNACTLPSNTRNKLADLNLSEAQRKTFTDEFLDPNNKVFKDAIKSGEEGLELIAFWKVLSKSTKEGASEVRTKKENLEKLKAFIEDGGDASKLESTFSNSSNPDKWLELKIKKGDIEDIAQNMDMNVSPASWTKEHKAKRWNNYKEENPDADFYTWSNQYDGNIKKSKSADLAVKEYAANSPDLSHIPQSDFERTWKNDLGENEPIEITLRNEKVIGNRRHDIYDEAKNKAIEVKDYSSHNVCLSKDIEKEALMDIELLNKEVGGLREVEWIFLNRGPSENLRKLLTENNITVTVINEIK
nr:HINT domain-containing protein [Flammeovirga kamogawensis]